ncbi:MAG: hypothetical protein HY475_00100 [Candidatus Terrybacteria bacterium]|nr:hypothetical protein [Candidatus Terrybacteria bacterium]
MKLQEKSLALAAAVTMTVAYVVCTVFVALFPKFAVAILGWMLHLVDINADVSITFGSFIGGLLPLVFYSYVGAWVFAWIYNRTVRS